MFNKNLVEIRKRRGFSQEELAVRLNVVRQTVSKWEKGLSVPDASMLIKLAEVLDVTVNELLGAKMAEEEDRDQVAEQLSRINEQLAIKNRRARRIWKVIAAILIGIVAVNIVWMALFMIV